MLLPASTVTATATDAAATIIPTTPTTFTTATNSNATPTATHATAASAAALVREGFLWNSSTHEEPQVVFALALQPYELTQYQLYS